MWCLDNCLWSFCKVFLYNIYYIQIFGPTRTELCVFNDNCKTGLNCFKEFWRIDENILWFIQRYPIGEFVWGRERTPGFRILDINWRCCFFFRMREVLIGIYKFALWWILHWNVGCEMKAAWRVLFLLDISAVEAGSISAVEKSCCLESRGYQKPEIWLVFFVPQWN